MCVQPIQKGVCAFWKYVRSGKVSVIVENEVAEAVRVSVHREGMRCIYEAPQEAIVATTRCPCRRQAGGDWW